MSLPKSKLKLIQHDVDASAYSVKMWKMKCPPIYIEKKVFEYFFENYLDGSAASPICLRVKINELEGHRVIKTQSWVWQRANWNFSARCWCQRLFCQNVKNEMSSNLHWKKSFRIFFRKLFGWLCRLADMFGTQNQWIRRS